MNSIVTVKNFKNTEIENTVRLISKYSMVLHVKLVNSVGLLLLRNLNYVALSKSAIPFYSTVESINYAWTDFFPSSSCVDSFPSVCGKNIYFFLVLKKNFLYFLLLQLLTRKTSSNSPISLPNKSKIYTLLRSPHTDKKSREQFRKRELKKLVLISMHQSFLSFLIKKEFITSKIRSTSFLGN